MRLLSLHIPGIVPLFYGLLSVATPDLTSNTAGPDVVVPLPEKNYDDLLNMKTEKHSLLIPDSSRVIEKNITLENSVFLKLECKLLSNSKDLKLSNITWKHRGEQLTSDLYTSNNTNNQWSTSYEFAVTDVNQTGSYSCIFNTNAEVTGTFNIQAPDVHAGSKSIVSYIRDMVVLKCDSSNHKPMEWLWYKVTENEQVALNLTSKKYKHCAEKGNETKLEILELSENDTGDYICTAVYKTGMSEGRIHLNVLSYWAPLRVFLVIAAEVAALVAVIFICEVLSKRKQGKEDDVKASEQMEQLAQLKSEDSSGAETNTTRQRK